MKAVEQGKFLWVGGGTHMTSSTHIRNVVEGLIKVRIISNVTSN